MLLVDQERTKLSIHLHLENLEGILVIHGCVLYENKSPGIISI